GGALGRAVAFAQAHAYGATSLETSLEGSVFPTRTLPRDGEEARTLKEIHGKLNASLVLMRGVTHSEFLKARADGKFYFIEIAARVGGDYIADVIAAGPGVNFLRVGARLSVCVAVLLIS